MSTRFADKHFTLSNGVEMPAMGFDTLRIKHDRVIYSALDNAFAKGYRLFDITTLYNNERQIGVALERLLMKYELKREDIFITAKLTPMCSDPSLVSRYFETSLQNLRIDYVDLYLMHFPQPSFFSNVPALPNPALCTEIWKEMIKLYEDQRARAIGVSNFSITEVAELIETTLFTPMVNQVKWHPYFCSQSMWHFSNGYNIQLQVFCSFSGLSYADHEYMFTEDAAINDIARRNELPVNQVLLIWTLQRGMAVLPKTKDLDRVLENTYSPHALSEIDLSTIDYVRLRIHYR